VGYVAAVGSGVRNVKEGDRVGVPWLYTACGYCEHCLSGWETLCHDQQNTGYSVNGGYAEYVLADPNYVGHLPDNVAFDEIAPILCAGVTVYKGIRVTDTRPGQWLAISGIGGLGHVAVQYAIAMGLHVVAVDISEEKLALARKLGAKLTINANTTDPVATIQKEIGGAHGVLVTAVSRSAFAQALGMVRRGGTVALNGLPPGDFPLPIFSTVLNGITGAVRSSARVAICRSRWILLRKAVFVRISIATALKISTRCSGNCVRELSMAASCWRSTNLLSRTGVVNDPVTPVPVRYGWTRAVLTHRAHSFTRPIPLPAERRACA
jgi:D-arabinose 1-dehydrogenase-like Zn-dependent alcohol dehydrogenase